MGFLSADAAEDHFLPLVQWSLRLLSLCRKVWLVMLLRSGGQKLWLSFGSHRCLACVDRLVLAVAAVAGCRELPWPDARPLLNALVEPQS